jgi:serine/threonine protein kinase
MSTDNWQQFKLVFQSALDLPPEQRNAYLDRVCNDPGLRAEVESLLLCYQGDVAVKKEPAVNNLTENPGNTQKADDDPLVESFIDHYQIVKKVAQSGPAAQYLALRVDEPGVKHVSIRIARTGTTDQFLRSQSEGIALRSLRHPNIASFLDTGSARDGSPYLATEYVEGIVLQEYCDLKRLNTRARLKLFVDLCDAVQYSHQHFIPHGGINSSRVLVTKNGTVKLLDLGLVDWFNRNRTNSSLPGGVRRSEMEYRSPEQMEGAPITTSDDVYSLGVLLYQLLTGHSPYRMKDGKEDGLLPAIFEAIRPSRILSQTAEKIRDDDGSRIAISPDQLGTCRSEKVRTTRKLLAGDLDSIVLKAIQKSSTKRYSSVEQFSGDLGCYLRSRPVSTRKATFLYRAGKFIERRKTSD